MPRKDIARRLHEWFDLSSPAVTNALHGMAAPSPGLVRLVESADSAREKKVLLTPKGERVVLAMAARGRDLVQQLIGDLAQDLSEDQIIAGLEFLRLTVAFFQRIHPGKQVPPRKRLASSKRLTPRKPPRGPRGGTPQPRVELPNHH